MITNRECAELLDVATKDLVRDIPIYASEWMTDRCQLTTFSTYMEVVASVDRVEILRNRNPRHFINLLKVRMFHRIEEIYRAMVEYWHMKPHYYVTHFINKDYEDGFVA